ncbi:MAG: serine hydrolase [bacterium]|nr:serine hydrolase [bacterium]
MKYVVICLMLAAVAAYAGLRDYEGGWTGEYPAPFELRLIVHQASDTLSLMQLTHGGAQVMSSYQTSGNRIHADFAEGLFFDGTTGPSGIRGFIQSGFHQYHIELTPDKNSSGSFQGTWRPLFVQNMDQRVLLSIENVQDDSYEAYLILGDKRAPQLMCGNFEKSGDTLIFQDYRTGIFLRGHLDSDKINLDFVVVGQVAATVPLHKSTGDFEQQVPQTGTITNLNDGWEVSRPNDAQLAAFKRLDDSVRAEALPNTHCILVAQHGSLIHEAYFEGYDAASLHDLRSAQKTITGAAIGAAIDAALFSSEDELLYSHLPESHQGTRDSDPRKAQITLRHLLTMSSGIDAVDFGTDRNSPASEDSYQQTGNWSYTIVDAPMLNDPGSVANYGSANACLTGIMLSSVTGGKPQLFMDDALFHPLGISDYVLQTDYEGTTYGAGGIFLSPRDMLKFGQLCLNGGLWNGNRLVRASWIEKSWEKVATLANSEKHEGYGYFWWERSYSAMGKEYLSHEARGAGGQYIAVIPQLDLVICITSGNYRNGKYWQPERIIEDYILPAVIR